MPTFSRFHTDKKKKSKQICIYYKTNKVAKPDKIVIEMLTASDDFGIDKVTEVINKIW